MFEHILVPIDDSPLSVKAAKFALRLARSHRARVTALHVIPPFRTPGFVDGVIPYPELYSPLAYRQSTERYSRKLLGRVEALAKAARVRCDAVFVTGAQPWRSIVKAARGRRCDLIVMGTHGVGGITAVVLGSQTTKVLTHSRTPVLVCR
jgi:nucleotide-binding universal stress UspA family protein